MEMMEVSNVKPKFLAKQLSGSHPIEYFLTCKLLHPPRTEKQALDWSVEKWKFIVMWLEKHPGKFLYDGGPCTCALCIFWRDCTRCTIGRNTVRKSCHETPYSQYRSWYNYLSAARQELEFLKGLRKEVKSNGKEVH